MQHKATHMATFLLLPTNSMGDYVTHEFLIEQQNIILNPAILYKPWKYIAHNKMTHFSKSYQTTSIGSTPLLPNKITNIEHCQSYISISNPCSPIPPSNKNSPNKIHIINITYQCHQTFSPSYVETSIVRPIKHLQSINRPIHHPWFLPYRH